MRTAYVSSTCKLMTAVATAAVFAVAAIMLAMTPRPADATPQFAAQTKLPCGQCHASPAGGGKLKPFGERFKAKGNKL
jgi:hypothetical protein